MPDSKQRLVLSGLFVVGVIALGVDRLVLSDGISGPARVAALPILATAPDATTETPGVISPTLNQRLRDLAQRDNLDLDRASDAFSLDEKDQSLRPRAKEMAISPDKIAFREDHRLIGVMASHLAGKDDDASLSRIAFVEALTPGQKKPHVTRLRVGDVIDGFTVTQIRVPSTDNAAGSFIVLARDSVTFRLFTTDSR